MPFFLILVGAVMIAAAVNGNHKELGDLWLKQIHGPGSFLNVLFVLILIGAVGAISGLRPLAVAFMGLVLVSMFLGNAGTTDSVNIIARARAQLLGGSAQ